MRGRSRWSTVLKPFVCSSLLLGLGAGCTESTSAYCRAWTEADAHLDGVSGAAGRLAAIDAVIAQLEPADQGPVRGLRAYAAVLYGVVSPDSEQSRSAVEHFLAVDAPILDARLHRECRVSLGRLAPFGRLDPKD